MMGIKQLTEEQREIRNKRAREYYHRNKELLKQRNNERAKQYYKEHKDEILDKLNTDYNKQRIQEYNKQYYEKNKQKIITRHKNIQLSDEQIEARRNYMKAYRENKRLS